MSHCGRPGGAAISVSFASIANPMDVAVVARFDIGMLRQDSAFIAVHHLNPNRLVDESGLETAPSPQRW
jgi:hypothetical protein